MTFDKFFTVVTRIGGIITAFIALGGFLVFMLNNEVIRDYLKEAVDVPELNIQLETLAKRVEESKLETRELNESVKELTETFANIKGLKELSSEPVIKILEGSRVSDARIGGVVTFNIRFVKLRECGPGQLSVWFRNGADTDHAFEDVSILDRNGMSIRAPAAPGEISERSWTARIPNDGSVTPGEAFAWTTTGYPECPNVPLAVSPRMYFQILDDDGRPVQREPHDRN